MQLVLDSRGLVLKKRNDCFQVIHQKERRLISPKRVSSIAVTQACLLSSEAIKLAVLHQIPVFLMDKFGRVEGRFWSGGYKKLGLVRRRQLQLCHCSKGTSWIIRLLKLKTQLQISNLQYLKNRKPGQSAIIEANIVKMKSYCYKASTYYSTIPLESRSTLMGLEGVIARTYWRTIAAVLPKSYTFKKRSYRPAEDQFNAALNYFYGMLYGIVEAAVISAGFDNQSGIMHHDSYNKATFVFDMIEPFRPWVDRLLIELCLQESLKNKHFQYSETEGWWLSKEGKQIIIPCFNQFLQQRKSFNNCRFSAKNHIYHFIGQLAKELQELPKDAFECPPT